MQIFMWQFMQTGCGWVAGLIGAVLLVKLTQDLLSESRYWRDEKKRNKFALKNYNEHCLEYDNNRRKTDSPSEAPSCQARELRSFVRPPGETQGTSLTTSWISTTITPTYTL